MLESETKVYEVLVIGAGQAGLAASYFLQRAGRDYLTLDAHQRVGDSWRSRWAGLRLFTPNRYNCLPGSSFPGADYALPDRLEVADYFEGYVAEHSLAVRTNSKVITLSQNLLTDGPRFRVELADGTVLLAASVVIAAGAYRTARVPSFAERLPSEIRQAHTSELHNLDNWLPNANQHVLVVGAGASGLQTATLLAQNQHVTLAGPDPGHLPRSVFGRDVYDYLYGLGILSTRVDSIAGKFLAKQPVGGEIRVGESVDGAAKRAGIRRVPKVSNYTNGAFTFEDGSAAAHYTAVVWATGYANQYSFLQVLPDALDDAGKPEQHKGKSPVAGLWWLGLHLMRRVNSSLLGGVGKDAEEVVAALLSELDKSSAKTRMQAAAA